MKSRLIALTVLAACAAGAPPAAADSVRTDYAVSIEGRAYYNVARITHTEDGEQSHHEDNEFTFKTEVPKVSFLDHIGGDSTVSMGSATGVRGHLATVNPNGARIDCDGSEIVDFQSGRLDAQYNGTSSTYKVRVLEAVQVQMDCAGLGPYQKRFESFGAPLGSGFWDGELTFTPGLVGQQEVRFPISNVVTGPDCPGFDEETTLCELSWKAWVVFRKTGWEDVPDNEDDLLVPLVPDQPAPPAQPEPVRPAAKPLVEAATTAAKLTATSVSVPVTCATGCTGTATATLGGGKARAAADAKPLARKRFTIAPGATKRITLAIPKRARKAVRRAGAVKVTLAITPSGGPKQTQRFSVKR
ncbi:MAG TPA: hypothetical protein VF529_12200 [Solirubrobacteraceae bacterium]|jgi:hypothetical protein